MDVSGEETNWTPTKMKISSDLNWTLTGMRFKATPGRTFRRVMTKASSAGRSWKPESDGNQQEYRSTLLGIRGLPRESLWNDFGQWLFKWAPAPW
jgi:hypothetical protein